MSPVLTSGELASAAEDATILDLDPDLTSQLLHVPSRDRLGVQAVLARHGQRVRSLSVCSGVNFINILRAAVAPVDLH